MTGDQVRVAVVAPPWYPVPPSGYGGIERVCFDLARGLVDKGHDVTLVGTESSGTGARFVPALPEPPTGLGTTGGPAQEVRYAAAVGQRLRELDVDIVHDHSLAGPLLGVDRTRPTVVSAHGPTDGPLGDYYRRLGLPIVATTNAQRRQAPEVDWLATVYNGIDVAGFPFRAEKDDYVLLLGRLSPEKGVHVAAVAARRAGVRLVVAGKASEPEEQQYLTEVVLPELAPGSEYVGEVHGAARDELLAGARCLLSPVLWEEPFGLVNVEALACGTPVVAFPRGSLPEIVRDGVTGIVCARPDDLPAALGDVKGIDPYACRSDALARFDTSVMVDGYLAAYRRALGRREGHAV